jgi:hypothetical protein
MDFCFSVTSISGQFMSRIVDPVHGFLGARVKLNFFVNYAQINNVSYECYTVKKVFLLCTGLNPPMTGKESQNKNFDMVFGTIFRICNLFKEESRNFINIFLLHKAA